MCHAMAEGGNNQGSLESKMRQEESVASNQQLKLKQWGVVLAVNCPLVLGMW